MTAAPAKLVIGIFVGGEGRRLGGVAKGHLVYEGQTLLARVAGLALGQVSSEHLYVVGESAVYDDFPGKRLADCPAKVGPLGGLRALLLQAETSHRDALAIAVDMPFLKDALLCRLAQGRCEGARAPRQQGRWQPLFARYRPEAALPVVDACLRAGKHSLQSVFAGLAGLAEELELSESEHRSLRDWDSPADLLSND